jgi:hypothetical protein
VKRFLFVIWALGSIAWLFSGGVWILEHEGRGPARSITFIVGTVWTGSFFYWFMNHHQSRRKK